MAKRKHRRKANSNQRGYGYDHRKRRTALLPLAIGTTCPARHSTKCTGLMVNPSLMHLDHSTPLALGGTHGDRIICAPCNLSLGAQLGNQLRQHREAGTRSTPRATRDW